MSLDVARDGRSVGEVAVHQGEAWHARDAQGAGFEALSRLLDAADVAVTARPLAAVPERTLEGSCESALLDHLRRQDEADALTHEKETIYRELFAPRFAEVAGFRQFAAQVRARGLKVAVGTAGDIGNVEFALGHLGLEPAPQAIVRGDEGLPGKPQPAIFLEAARRIAADPAHCIVFEDAPFGIEAARRAGMRAVAICSTHTPEQLAGPHVLAAVRDYTELMNTDFLESIHVATA